MVNDLKMDREKAWEQCTGIVVHGDLLAEKHLAEENLPDDDLTKGLFLKEWISKTEVASKLWAVAYAKLAITIAF